VRHQGICKLQKGFVLEKIFPFYHNDDGISIHSYPEANKLPGNETDQGYPPNCPLVFPPGHDMTNGNNNLILRSPYIIKVFFSSFNFTSLILGAGNLLVTLVQCIS